MIIFCNEEPKNTSCLKKSKILSWILKDAAEHSKKGKFSTATLKDAFVECLAFRGRMPFSSPIPQEEYTDSDFGDAHEISEIITRCIEAKTKRKTGSSSTNFQWKNSILPIQLQQDKKGTTYDEEERFVTPRSFLSRCSSASSLETFGTAKTSFSRSSSFSTIDFMDIRKRNLIIRQLRDCQGWPFGLCRKALLLPPLPKSPSDSWLWNKSAHVNVI